MRLYEIEVLLRAKQRITVSAPNEEWACDLATDKVDVREAVGARADAGTDQVVVDVHLVGSFAAPFHHAVHQIDGARVERIGHDGTGERVPIGIQRAVSAARERALQDMGPGVGQDEGGIGRQDQRKQRELAQPMAHAFRRHHVAQDQWSVGSTTTAAP